MCVYIYIYIYIYTHIYIYVGGRSLARIAGSNPAVRMNIYCEFCVLSGRGLCDELITPPDDPYGLLVRHCVCDLQTSRMRTPYPALGLSTTGKNIVYLINP